MNRTKLKTYAPQARRDFIRAMTDRAAFYGLTKDKFEPVTVQGDVALIGGKAFPAAIAAKRERLEERVERNGFDQTMEAMAYTWFNRLVAIRYMELHGYLDHGYRVLSHPEGKPTPEIVEHAEHVDLPGLDRDEVINLKLDGTKEAELYRKLLIAQCNALHAAMPFLFERIADETELLLPDSLLHSDSLVRKLVSEIDEADWQAVEIIGWLYQFYISEKKDEVIGSVVKSEDIPAATQLFTPNWIVKYLVQNSLGRQWLATYPDSPLKAKMEFYIEPAEQTPEVQTQLKAITPESLNPEELTFLDPACGSGHILVEAYSLLRDIYLERGYRLRDIPKLILTKNLFGLEIDDRAAQLAAFAMLMTARADDRNVLSEEIALNVFAIQQTDHLDVDGLLRVLPPTDPLRPDLTQLVSFFEGAKTYGSLLRVPSSLASSLPKLSERLRALSENGDLFATSVGSLGQLVRQGESLARRYAVVAANPPYMGSMPPTLKAFVASQYPSEKADLYAVFLGRLLDMAMPEGRVAAIAMHGWMFLGSFEPLRRRILEETCVNSLLHLGSGAFDSISGAVVQTAAFDVLRTRSPENRPRCFRLLQGGSDEKSRNLRAKTEAFTRVTQRAMSKMPSATAAYWVAEGIAAAFENADFIGDELLVGVGLQTGANGRFIRFWHEVAKNSICFDAPDGLSARRSGRRWFPCNKGGPATKWYGNQESVIDWEDDGARIKANVPSAVIRNEISYFQPVVAWTKVASGKLVLRFYPAGFVHNDASCVIFSQDFDESLFVMSLLNSSLSDRLVTDFNPTLNITPGQMSLVPLPANWRESCKATAIRAGTCVNAAQRLWDRNERSWHFQRHPLISDEECRSQTCEASSSWDRSKLDELRARLKTLEDDNEREMYQAYALDVPVSTPTLGTDGHSDLIELVQSLPSYVIGCAMGRYSLDKPGLIYAHSGNEGFDPASYATFPADKDGIIPVTEEHWFADDAAARFEEFVSKVWPVEHLDENLAFVAEGLIAKSNESPRQTVRRYLSDGFYKHHLQTYKRRPIYWLFTSGKQRAFQALVYLHRYNEGTLSRMRTEYVIPLQGKIASRIEKLEADKAKATSTSHRKGIEKEQDKLRKQQAELIAFDEKLRHYADLRIKLDLDDGVKVNYRKFADPTIGEIVAEVKAVCGKEDDE